MALVGTQSQMMTSVWNIIVVRHCQDGTELPTKRCSVVTGLAFGAPCDVMIYGG